ncbi:hypothetical protein J7443_22725 [Tropicibacter sp. R15_0]|uniref:hypothetical protein n=1 Tax=Tropicibacter sp. R15_0 TaxID=2821101 RepID=UPI001ADBC51C|nr:hypothetical protein [Tropicibacter sp. R15_0]MBO9468059.1 hypothetical protein [Tropicibacter sp. R15_0]
MTSSKQAVPSNEVVQQQHDKNREAKHSLDLSKRGVRATGYGLVALTIIALAVIAATAAGVDVLSFWHGDT